jgi:hypothetical protein
MSEKPEKQNAEIVGMGVKYPTPIKAPRERVWAVMVDKVYNTGKYLPATDVKTTDIIPGRHVYREMKVQGRQMNENIYLDESRCEIRFDVVDEDAVHVNMYYPDTGIIEYWQAMKKTKEIAEGSQ